MRRIAPTPRRATRATHLRLVTVRERMNIAALDATEVPQLAEIYRRFAPYVAAIGVRILGRDGDDVDDLVQDVFVEATRGIGGLSSPDALKAWLARIAVRTAMRRKRRELLLRTLHLAIDDVADCASLASPEATPEQRAFVARVCRALDKLPANDRTAWVMRYVQGETLEEAAALCACSLSTYQRRLRRASELLDKRVLHA